MTTPAYTSFSDTHPVSSDNGNTALDYCRTNDLAERDSIVWQNFSGWNVTPSGGTAAQPQYLTAASGTERLRKTITWGSSGGSDGNPTKIVHEWSNDSGSSYSARTPYKTLNYTYDTDGNFTGSTWDNS